MMHLVLRFLPRHVKPRIQDKDNCNVVFGWMPIDEIQNVIIYPDFLKKEIYNLCHH